MESSSVQRCFIAYMLTKNESERLQLALATIKQHYPHKIRWIIPENYHITLKFLGGIDQKKVGWWKNQLYRIAKNNNYIDVFLDRTSLFNLHKTGVLVCLCHPQQKLVELVSCIEKTANLPLQKSIQPHVTLAYIKKQGNFSSQMLLHKIPLVSLKINHLALVSSQLQPSGSHYSKIAVFSLQSQ